MRAPHNDGTGVITSFSSGAFPPNPPYVVVEAIDGQRTLSSPRSVTTDARRAKSGISLTTRVRRERRSCH